MNVTLILTIYSILTLFPKFDSLCKFQYLVQKFENYNETSKVFL